MKLFKAPLSSRLIQGRLLQLAVIFLLLFSIILTIAPAARERSWSVPLRWSHWLGFLAWILVFSLGYVQINRRLPDSDPYLLPVAGLLTGWGLLTIWRLQPDYGFRQSLWLLLSGAVLIAGLYLPLDLRFLRRYRYIWLFGGLLLTGLTLIFGTDPIGGSERLWLGCCGVYFQPSEPLKLLLIIYLAAYFADRTPLTPRFIPLLIPGAAVTALAILLLLAQHDLGTASIFIFLFMVSLYVASGKQRVLWISLGVIVLACIGGYFLFDVVRIRVDAWLNPWIDPSGRSYQIVQSLLAIANGGTLGRGPGMGNPGLVPVAISDFIFSAMAEETGLVGTIGLFILIGFLIVRGMRIALRAPDHFRRYLAAGLTAYLGVQGLVIIGGNMRLFPLTGVTLPFVSYGGSSLLTSFLALLFLLLISGDVDAEPAPLIKSQPFTFLAALVCVGLFAAGLVNGWWAIWRGPDLLTRTDNARRSIADRYVKRGSLIDRHGNPITVSEGSSGNFVRTYLYPDLGPIIGYTHPTFGQAGLESSLDPYLRGLQGNPASTIWLDHLLYGQPPPGLDVRLSVDLGIQTEADQLLGKHAGAIVLMNAETGEILAIASHPTFDPNSLDSSGAQLSIDPAKPLLDRAAQGLYPPGSILNIFFQAAGLHPNPSGSEQRSLYSAFGFYTTPLLRLPVANASPATETLRISPLQMDLAISALTHNGIRPAPRLAMAVNTPAQGWVVLPALTTPAQAISSTGLSNIINQWTVPGQPMWEGAGRGIDGQKIVTWYVAGTLPDWSGVPIALTVLIEGDDPSLAEQVGRNLLESVVRP